MARRKRQKRSYNRTESNEKKEFEFGILVVHGVGNQNRGSTSALLAERLRRTFEELGIDTSTESQGTTRQSIAPRRSTTSRMTVGDDTEVLISEAHWADLIRTSRGKKLSDVTQRLFYVLSILPYLVAISISPRSHEPLNIYAPSEKSFSLLPSSIRAQLREMTLWTPTFWRFLTFQGVLLVVWFSVTTLSATLYLPLLASLALASWLNLRGHWDIVEHIRVIGKESPIDYAIQGRIVEQLDVLSAKCRYIWVIGHSQGGYLAHAVLSRDTAKRWPNVVKFTGLASGLRPIHLINTVRGREWTVSGWLMIFANSLLCFGVLLAFEPGGLLNSDSFRALMQLLILSVTQVNYLLEVPSAVDEAFRDPFPSNWISLALLIPGLACFAAGLRARKDVEGSVKPIRDLPRKIAWEELSSPSDIVGSMSIPELPEAARCRTVPSLRNPIGDHLFRSQLSYRSIFRLEIAEWLTRKKADDAMRPDLSALTRHLSRISERAYTLRLAIHMLYFFLAVLFPTLWGASIFGSIQAAFPVAALLTLLTLSISSIWWLVNAKHSITAFLLAMRERTVPTYSGKTGRSEAMLFITLFSAFVCALGAVGMTVYSSQLASLGAHAALTSVVPTLSTVGASAAGITLFALLAFCLALAEVRGVRLILAISIVIAIYDLHALISLGGPWFSMSAPGGLVMVIAMVALLSAFTAARPLQAGSRKKQR
ncbi:MULTISPECIES: hypothetical protein [Clavibacter]|uniref:hypothetical protein n=1 Tax=Clavibacter TaxID=1573 RepID=UPI000A694B17|nr:MULTISPECIES: hypothetical protein [Clavibacter]MDA3806207.1 hypothetical protein [Clavibacter sp. CT19]